EFMPGYRFIFILIQAEERELAYADLIIPGISRNDQVFKRLASTHACGGSRCIRCYFRIIGFKIRREVDFRRIEELEISFSGDFYFQGNRIMSFYFLLVNG